MTGNPQNILIGSFSGISYARFAATLSPVALAGLVLTFVLIWVMHRGEFRQDDGFGAHPAPAHLHRPLAARAILISLAMIAAFFAGAPPAVAALVAGGAMLATRIVRSERIYREMFVVVAGLEGALLTPEIVSQFGVRHLDRVPVLSLATAALSNLVSNVPAVLVLRPFIGTAGEADRAWLTVAMASTPAGNLTIIGSVANLIVVQGARAKGVAIGF
jgi:Na+/H+ antiporter NhaD/arsenite permease-like protein